MENGKLKLAALTIRLCLMTSICVWAACSAPAQEKVSLLVTNGRVVTMDAQRHVIEDGAGDFCTEKTGVAKTFHLE